MDLDVARAVNGHCLRHLTLKITQIGDRRRCNVGNAMSNRDFRHGLTCTEDVARFQPYRGRRRRPRGWRRVAAER